MTTPTPPAVKTATLTHDGEAVSLPLVTGSEGETAVEIKNLRKESGLITLDPGYGNTGSCTSAITFIDGEKGILRYRGYPIEEIAQRARFTEICYLLIYGTRPTDTELADFRAQLIRIGQVGAGPDGHHVVVVPQLLASAREPQVAVEGGTDG